MELLQTFLRSAGTIILAGVVVVTGFVCMYLLIYAVFSG